jgi:hypothetical protein
MQPTLWTDDIKSSIRGKEDSKAHARIRTGKRNWPTFWVKEEDDWTIYLSSRKCCKHCSMSTD